MNEMNTQPLPSMAQLIKATGLALAVSLVILMTAILPAEYGVDPIGAGKLLGLTELGASPPEKNVSNGLIPGATAGELQFPSVLQAHTDAKHYSEEKQLVLQPGRGIELKAKMRKGEQFVFNWEAENGALYVDMHGEPPNAGNNEFTSYWVEKKQSAAKGIFVAPFDGTHGWYWRNRQSEPVTINVKVSGFFEKLYIP